MYLCCVERADSDQNWIFYEFLKVARKSGQSPCTIIFGQISRKLKRREFCIFIIFPNTYTCTYVV